MSDSILESAKDFEPLSKTVEVPFLYDKDKDLVLTVRRINNSELALCQRYAMEQELLLPQKLSPENRTSWLNVKFGEKFIGLILGAITGWECKSKNFPFNKENLEAFGNGLFLTDQTALAKAYDKAAVVEKKTGNNSKKS